jgi:hypothetical protein
MEERAGGKGLPDSRLDFGGPIHQIAAEVTLAELGKHAVKPCMTGCALRG